VDPLVSLMMVEKVPDSTYEMIGGLDKQIKEIKEVIIYVTVVYVVPRVILVVLISGTTFYCICYCHKEFLSRIFLASINYKFFKEIRFICPKVLVSKDFSLEIIRVVSSNCSTKK